jgi:2-amino-4-hydroxy-6-hydroxymethyldihydropteridine diphosphokinase
MATVYVSLGSNLGDRLSSLGAAVEGLAAVPQCRVTAVSGVFESEPVGGPPGQGRYLNAVVRLDTDRDPFALLAEFQALERGLGRVRGEPWGARTIDLDLLLYDDVVVRSPLLTVPHPRIAERPFVLGPLAELAPDLIHPTLGRSVRDLLRTCTAERSSGLARLRTPVFWTALTADVAVG